MVSGDDELGGRLLVVDDDENNRDMLSRRLLRRGCQVEVASNGADAISAVLERRDEGEFDCVLLDIEMPGMSGLEVLRKIREHHTAERLPVIMATARSDREDVVQALGMGANDYVTKPLDFPVVVARVKTQLAHKRAVDQIISLEEELRRRNDELDRANQRMKHSLDSAARVQHSLLPGGCPVQLSGWECDWAYEPCDELGGDIMKVFPLSDGHIAMYLLDVSGHGVPAALLSVTLSRTLEPVPHAPSLVESARTQVLTPRSPAVVVKELNRRFPMSVESGNQYFTLFYGVLDPSNGVLRYVSAGHPPALVVAADGTARALPGSGFAVGWFDDAEPQEQEVTLADGERLVVYSDGISETRGSADDMFGEEGIATFFSGKVSLAERAASVQDLLHTVADYRGAQPPHDDMTVFVMSRSPDGAARS